jgi:hypothetical protein
MDKYTWKEIVLALEAEIYERPYWLEEDYPEIYEYLENNSLDFKVMKPFIDKEEEKQECLDLFVNMLLDNGNLRDDYSELIGDVIKYFISQGAMFKEELLVNRKYETIVSDNDNNFFIDKESFLKEEMGKNILGFLPGFGSMDKNKSRPINEYENKCREKEKERLSKGIMLLSEEIELYKNRGLFIDILGKNNLLTNKVLNYTDWKMTQDEDIETQRLEKIKFYSKFLSNY